MTPDFQNKYSQNLASQTNNTPTSRFQWHHASATTADNIIELALQLDESRFLQRFRIYYL